MRAPQSEADADCNDGGFGLRDGAMNLLLLPEEHGMPLLGFLSPTVIVVSALVALALGVAALLAWWKVRSDTARELEQIYAHAPMGFEWQEFNTQTDEVVAHGFCSFPIRPPMGPSSKPGHAFRSWPVESHSRLWSTMS